MADCENTQVRRPGVPLCQAAIVFLLLGMFVFGVLAVAVVSFRQANWGAIQGRAVQAVAAIQPRDADPFAVRSVATTVMQCVRKGDFDSIEAARTGLSRLSAARADAAARGLVDRCAARTWFSDPRPVSAIDTTAVNAWLSRLSVKPSEHN